MKLTLQVRHSLLKFKPVCKKFFNNTVMILYSNRVQIYILYVQLINRLINSIDILKGLVTITFMYCNYSFIILFLSCFKIKCPYFKLIPFLNMKSVTSLHYNLRLLTIVRSFTTREIFLFNSQFRSWF